MAKKSSLKKGKKLAPTKTLMSISKVVDKSTPPL